MISISGNSAEKYSAESTVARDLNTAAKKLQIKDSTLWGEAAAAEAANRLNWIDLPVASRELLPQLDALSAWARSNNLSNFILCGMGGSSLAPEVMAKAYGKTLTTLDTTDPEQIKLAIPKSLKETLIIVGSKSGSTIETASQKSFFEDLFLAAGLDPINHFVIITDPDSPLDRYARASKLRVINADPSVGGRFSALSAFGLVPAALLGIDVSVLLDDADLASQKFAEPNSPAIKLATLMFEETSQNFALVDHKSNVPGIGDWIEQLVAESTGKNQKGRLPIVLESASAPIGGSALSIGFAEGIADINVVATLGEHFILWEWVTALLCRALEVDPFNQPNVTEAKDRTGDLLNEWSESGIPAMVPAYENSSLALFTNLPCPDLSTALAKFIDSPSKYFAVMAYLNRETDFAVTKVRSALAAKTSRGVTFGWAPRFLHSTGQFHKGGQPNGSFLQITGESKEDLSIPGKDFTFHTLLMAQALGDGQALTSRKLPLLRVHLKNREAGIAELLEAISKL
jgi:glucose-6-phosphate isomerase